MRLGRHTGTVSVSDDAAGSRLRVKIDFPDSSMIHAILTRVRGMFDVDSDPVLIANALEGHPGLKKLLEQTPGIRLPSGWDSFEIAIAVILGQLVSVDRGRALVANLIEMFGEDSGVRSADGSPIRLFPSPERIASLDESDLKFLKTTVLRKRTLIAFARAVFSGALSLESTQDVGTFVTRVREIPGIGAWTASYMALKCLRHTDAFPETDLILARGLERQGEPAKNAFRGMSPWRGYAAALLWRSHSK